MAKTIPLDALIILHNRLMALTQRHSERRLIVAEAAQFYGVSTTTVYRALYKHNKPEGAYRSDYNNPRNISKKEMQYYCELIAALKLRTTNKKNHRLSTKECIQLLEAHGIETPDGLVKAPVGLLKKSMTSLYLKRFGLNQSSLLIQPTVVHFQAEHSNECWQFDFSPSDLKQLSDAEKNDTKVLMLASIVDDRSGVVYQEYHYAYGEDAMTALRFLFNAMAPKKYPGNPFQGIPKTIYTDNGPATKSTLFKRVMAYLGVEVITHLPRDKDGRRKTARAKGKVERQFLTTKTSLEPKYHIHPPQHINEANEWLRNYLQNRNQEKHRYEDHSRLDDWKNHLPKEGFKVMCTWEKFSTLARDPETRTVGQDACVSINGEEYQLSGELAGLTVTLLWGIFDNELCVEHDGKSYGPFYPFAGPIPFGQYRPFKKNSREKYADKIGLLAKELSIPRAAMNNNDPLAKKVLTTLVDEGQPSVPFTSPNPFEQTQFSDTIEAKVAISRRLGYPLGQLLPEQLAKINEIVAESLDKQIVMAQIKQLFTLRLLGRTG